MAVNWAELSSLLACTVPEANVNLLHDEARPEVAKALEVRPKPRMFDALPSLIPKWTVIIFAMQSGRVCVAIFKMDREVLEQSEFDPSQTMDIAEFVKSHPFLNSKWSVCQGFGNRVLVERSGGGCEMLISGEGDAICKFCSVKGILERSEELVKVEVKEELEVCPEVDGYSDVDYTEDMEYPRQGSVFTEYY